MANIKKDNQAAKTKLNLKKVMPTDPLSLKIMSERAKSLAMVEADDAEKKLKMVHYIKFKVGSSEYYGIPYSDIEDVKNVDTITKVPKSPDYITGILNWHGKIIPIINLARFFKVADASESNSSPFVATVAGKKQVIGIVFSDVIGVESYVDGELDENIAASVGIKNEYIYGIHQGTTTILNAKNILSDISAELMKVKGADHE